MHDCHLKRLQTQAALFRRRPRQWLIHLAALLLALTSVATAAEPPPPACEIQSGQTELADGTLHYHAAGTGPAVLLLHGLFAQKEQWDGLLCALASAGLRGLAPDLPGYGESRGFPLAVYRLDTQAERLHQWLEQLAVHEVEVAGNSMGGAIAVEFVKRDPDRVRSLAFIGPPLGATPWSEGVRTAIQSGINPFIPLDGEQFALEMGLLFAEPPAIPPQIEQAALADYRERTAHYRQVWDIVSLHACALDTGPLKPLPILILWGEQDGIFPVASAPAFQARLPGSQLHILPRSGHLPMLERPAETAASYLRFLGR